MTEKDVIVKDSANKRINDTIIEFKKNINKIYEKIQKDFQIQLSDEIIDEILKNEVFNKFISQIDSYLTDFLTLKGINSLNKIYFKQDWEMHDFIHINLLLKFEDLSFDNELKLWHEVIHFIEEKINTLIETTSEKIKDELKSLNQRFSVLLDLE